MEDKKVIMTLYGANCCGTGYNTSYPNKHEITCLEDFTNAVKKDFVCVEYKGNHRKADNFISSDCIAMDCDNDSDNPSDWKTPDDVAKAFPDIPFFIQFSRNNMKQKVDKAPRPRFHVVFPIEKVTDPNNYSLMKQQIMTVFPFFDSQAMDNARLMFGTEEPKCDFIPGSRHLEDMIRNIIPCSQKDNGKEKNTVESTQATKEAIAEGERNSTMFNYALKVLTRLGDTSKAIISFFKLINAF